MAEQSPTVSIWASCSIVFDDAVAEFESQDGSWDEPEIVTEGTGIVLLSLLPDHGIDQLACTESVTGRFVPGLVRGYDFTVEHVDDVQKRIRIFIAGILTNVPFTIQLFRYLNHP